MATNFQTEYEVGLAFKESLKVTKRLGDLLWKEADKRRSDQKIDPEEKEVVIKDINDLERLLQSAQTILNNWWDEEV